LVERFKEKFAVLFSKDNEQKNKNLETKRHGLAVASMVLGIVGFLTASVGFGLILCLLAVIFGSIARKKIKNSGGFYTGKGMAIAGLVLGIIPLAVFVVALFIALALGGF